jgi:hypothetical protein
MNQQPYKPGSPTTKRAGGTPPSPVFVSTDEQRLHANDHTKMAFGHPATLEPLYSDEYDRIKSNAQAGCPHCAAFVAGAQRDNAAGREKARLAVGNRAARTQRPTTTRAMQRNRAARQAYEFELRAAGDRAAGALKPLPGEPITSFLKRQAMARGQGELAFRGVPYSTSAPVPDASQTYTFKDSGQAKTLGGPAGNGSISPIVTVQPQSVGKRVLYNTQDAAALDAGVPGAAIERPTPTEDISLDPGAFHVGGHQMPRYPGRQVGVNSGPTVSVPTVPTPTLMAPAAATPNNSGSPTAAYGQVNFAQRQRLEQAAERQEARIAGDRAEADLRPFDNEHIDAFLARKARVRGEAELAARAAYRRMLGKA